MRAEAALVVLVMLPLSYFDASTEQTQNTSVSMAVRFLTTRFNPKLGLIYESDDPRGHWLKSEFPSYPWSYNQTYWLYSDNLFAAYALEPYRPDISETIKNSLSRYNIRSDLFELVVGENVDRMRDAINRIVEQHHDYVILVRQHSSAMPSWGIYADLICYRSLKLFLEGRIREARRCLQQAEVLWHGKGLDDWSFLLVDGYYSNQKLALFLYTARVLQLNLRFREAIEAHLWRMQLADGGIASLSNKNGRPMGSTNTETTALTLLIYNTRLIEVVQKRATPLASPTQPLTILGTIIAFAWIFRLFVGRKRDLRSGTVG